ncbi:glutamine synthetase [Streptomyces rubiginosohelvolus]
MRRSCDLPYAFVEVSWPPRYVLRSQKQEWEECRREVTTFELKALLPLL